MKVYSYTFRINSVSGKYNVTVKPSTGISDAIKQVKSIVSVPENKIIFHKRKLIA